MSGEQYNENYFIRGQELGISGYTNYRYLPDLTLPMARSIISHLKIRHDDTILDFGCARGYLVKAFREMGYWAYGYDVSEWALENADPEAFHYLTRLQDIAFPQGEPPYSWVIAKDVLEHIPQVADTVNELMRVASKGVFAVVPLGYGKDGYTVPEYDLDVTHIHRMTLGAWANLFIRPGWSVTMSYRLKGVKDNYSQFLTGNGFIVARRI